MSPMAGRPPQPHSFTHVGRALALCAAIAAWLPAIAQASDDDLVYPKFECYDVLDANAYTFRFGTFSFKDSAATPAINFFEPSRFAPSAPTWWLRSTPSCFAPSRAIAARLA